MSRETSITFADLDKAGRVEKITEMLRQVSLARTPIEVLRTFATTYWPLRPIEFILSISQRDLEPPKYRITRQVDVGAILRGTAVYNPTEPWRNRSAIPVLQGGALWELIKDGKPRLIHDMDLSHDPILGDSLAGLRSAQVIPLFDVGEPRYWSLQFRREREAFSPDEFEQAMIVGNLLGGTNTRLLLMEEINQLNTRLSAQFEEVARVQRSLLPRVMPDIPGLDLATSYLTSDEAGGDYYDFFRLPGGCWGILIADVSGHGAAAATVMAMLHGILHAFVGATSTIPAPDEVMRYANGRLLEAGLESSFVTAFFAIYNPETSVLRFARAGHNPPIVKRPDRGCVELDSDRAGPPLGVFEPYEVACEEVRLDPGDTLVLYTDGITEAFSASREMFTAAKLMDAISRVSCHPDAVIDAVHQSLFKHTGGARTRADDQTLVVLRRRGGA